MHSKKNKGSIFIVKLVISSILLGWVFWKVDWSTVLNLLSGIDIKMVCAYVVLLFAGIGISAYKWMLLAEYKGFRYPYKKYFHLYLSGMFINNFFPSFIGGDAYRAYKLGVKKDEKRSPAFSTVVFDRLTGFWGTSILIMFFSLFVIRNMERNSLWLLIVYVVCVAVLIDFLFLYPGVRGFFKRIIVKFPLWVSRVFLPLFEEVGEFSSKRFLIRILGYSLLFGIVGVGLANFVLMRSLGVDISIMHFMSVVFLISIISSLPLSINNIGVKEWAYITFFGMFGVSAEAAVTTALLGRFIQMTLSFLALPGYLRERNSIE